MSETKYFCKRLSEFDISELGLSETDLKYAMAAFKRQSYLVVAARKRQGGFLTGYLSKALRREDREKGICVKHKDRFHHYFDKAYEISKRIYKKIDEAGYIRHDDLRDHKNLGVFYCIMSEVREYYRRCINDAKSHRFSCYDGGCMTRRADEWLDGIDDLKEALDYIFAYFEEIDGFSECETEKYETYDFEKLFEKLDHVAADVMHNIFTPKQMEMMEWIKDYRYYDSSCVRVCTEEERMLYSAAVCSVLTNARYIKAVFKQYL